MISTLHAIEIPNIDEKIPVYEYLHHSSNFPSSSSIQVRLFHGWKLSEREWNEAKRTFRASYSRALTGPWLAERWFLLMKVCRRSIQTALFATYPNGGDVITIFQSFPAKQRVYIRKVGRWYRRWIESFNFIRPSSFLAFVVLFLIRGELSMKEWFIVCWTEISIASSLVKI